MALCRIFAVSVISSMNVERPPARSSEAPMRVNMRSSGPRTARLAGTKRRYAREWRSGRSGAYRCFCRPCSGPVMISMRRALIEAQIVRHEGFAAGALDHRMPAAVDAQHRLLHEFRLDAIERRRRAPRSRRARRAARCAAVVRCSAGRLAVSRSSQPVVKFPFARERPIARAQHLVLEGLQFRA